MSDQPGLKYSPNELMLLLLLLLFLACHAAPQLRFSPQLDESGNSQASSKLAAVNKRRFLQNVLHVNGDQKS